MKPVITGVTLLLAALLAVQSHAAVLSGTVKDSDGKPLEGVMVRVTDPASGASESVFTSPLGNYTLATGLQGELNLRLRTPYYRDTTDTVVLTTEAQRQKDLVMQAMTDPEEISESLPAAYHFGNIPFETGPDAAFSRLHFQRDCLSCHQLGNSFTRLKRPPESWAYTIERMHGYMNNFDIELRDKRSVILSEGFDGKPITVRPEFPLDEALSHAKIYEYRLDKPGVPHDVIFNPNDGLLYSVDQLLDYIAITNPATGKTDYIKEPGGEDMQAEQLHVKGELSLVSGHGTHSLAMGPDGKYYVTNTSTRSLGVFNPVSREWEDPLVIDADTKANYPHTIRFDTKGIAWFSLLGSDQVGRFDPATGKFRIINLPSRKPLGIAGFSTQAYGLDIHPVDGSVWYGRLFADKIGRVDPVTLEVTEYDSPVSGPRRMRFDKKGVLWVAGYSQGELARIEVNPFKGSVYRMPEYASGFGPAPYALGVHPETQDIWINENMTDRIYRFIPAEERFIAYPIPLRGTYTRDMTFTDDGQVCMSNNPVPAAALEGGVLEIICIDPAYDPKQ